MWLLDFGVNFRIIGRREFDLGNPGYPVCMAAAEKGAAKIPPKRKSSVSPYSWRAGKQFANLPDDDCSGLTQVQSRAEGAPLGAPEGAEITFIKQKAAISASIFGCEMRFSLYDEDNLKVSGFRGVHRQHQTEVLRAPSVRKRR